MTEAEQMLLAEVMAECPCRAFWADVRASFSVRTQMVGPTPVLRLGGPYDELMLARSADDRKWTCWRREDAHSTRLIARRCGVLMDTLCVLLLSMVQRNDRREPSAAERKGVR